VGWVAANGARRERIEYLKFVSSIASPSLTQLAVAELLGSGRYERYLREVRGRYASAVERMSDAVMSIFPQGTRISRPQGGFVIWVELPEGTDSFSIARRALRQRISVAPGPLFSASGKYKNYIRLSSAREWDARLENGLRCLEKLI
jgi:DNA-binding transcriptional MocR family regulator